MKTFFKVTVAIASFSLLIVACKKKEQPKQYSEWYVNGEKFSTNDVRVDIGKAVSILSTGLVDNGFNLNFYSSGLPAYGNYLIKCEGSPSSVCFNFYYHHMDYSTSKIFNHFLVASSENNKAKYTLDSTWFINNLNPNDSVLVKGTFREP